MLAARGTIRTKVDRPRRHLGPVLLRFRRRRFPAWRFHSCPLPCSLRPRLPHTCLGSRQGSTAVLTRTNGTAAVAAVATMATESRRTAQSQSKPGPPAMPTSVSGSARPSTLRRRLKLLLASPGRQSDHPAPLRGPARGRPSPAARSPSRADHRQLAARPARLRRSAANRGEATDARPAWTAEVHSVVQAGATRTCRTARRTSVRLRRTRTSAARG